MERKRLLDNRNVSLSEKGKKYVAAPHLVSSPSRDTSNPSETTSCQGLTQTTDSLILTHCGGGDDLLIPRSESCGYVYPQQTPAATEQAEACIMQDYRQCYGAALGYEPSGTLGYSFQINFTCKLTVVVSSSQSRFPCTSLAQQADGLHALNCGAVGTIRIPAHP